MARKNQKAPWEEEEEIIWVSKSEMKRDMTALQTLGEELVALKPSVLAHFPLPEELAHAIKEAQRFKLEARRRQLQYIGRLMRNIDIEPIQAALDKLRNKHDQQSAQFHKVEQWRDRLIQEGDTAIEAIMQDYPLADRQQLRQLVRQANKELQTQKPPKAARELFQQLRALML